MASVTTRPNGHRWVTFKAPNGKRQTIRLGAATASQATAFKENVERLLVCKKYATSPDGRTSEWLTLIADDVHDKLAKCGLVEKRGARTVGELVAWHLERHVDRWKQSTVMNIGRAAYCLKKFFGEDQRLSLINKDDAEKLRVWMLKSGNRYNGPLSPTTVSRLCRRCRQMFAAAVDNDWVRRNPFSEMRGWRETNTTRDVYVTPTLVQQLIEQTADAELRLILALGRFAGLRCPSEMRPLRWEWVDWSAGYFQVASPKTEHYEGRANRLVPIFPEVRPHLERAWKAAPEGDELMLPRQYTGAAITGRLSALCRQSRVLLWPKPWVNMRASCEHDLLKAWPIDQVASWMGHSPVIALRHYNRAAAEYRARQAGIASAIGERNGVAGGRVLFS